MSVFANTPLSRLWNGRSRSDTNTQSRSTGFVGDAAPPFTELTESGLGRIPTSEELAKIGYYHSKITFKEGEFVDMDLTHERRHLICAGRLFRRADSTFERKGLNELFVLLFDNHLVITNIVGTGPNPKFQVYKRPIPLDLLRVETSPPPLDRRGTTGRKDTIMTVPPDSWGITPPPGDPRTMALLVIHHDSRLGGTTRLYAESEDVQLTWKSKLDEAVLFRQKSSQVFEASIVAREEFLTMGPSLHTYPPENRPITGTITCANPFVTRDGRTLLAIGCAEGLWIGIGKDLQSFRWVLRVPVEQCVVSGEYGLIIILSNGDLHVFDLEESVPKSTGRLSQFRPKALQTKGRTDFFRTGKLNGEMYIVAAVKERLDTVFYIWEVVMTTGPDGPSPDPREFQLIHTFFLPSECNEVIFLRTKLCILHGNGFTLVKLPEMSFVGIPQAGDQNITECKGIIKRCSSARPISMTRIETEIFFLCYDKFGVYVDRYGVPLPDREVVEWEGQACRASFRFPYVLLFSPTFVEIRHLITGHLIQVIRADAAMGNYSGSGGGCSGGAIRCLWDGRGGGRDSGYDPEFGLVPDGDYAHGNSDGSEIPTVLGVVDLPIPTTVNEWGAQSSSSSVVTQRCVFTLFSPVPPPYSALVEEPTIPYDVNSII